MIRDFLIFFVIGIIFLSGYTSASDLRITEVLVDGSDEFVEIVNIGTTDFAGTITLSGVKSSPLVISNISLSAGSVILLGDNLSMLSSDNVTAKRTGLGLSMGDSNTLSIQLLVDNTIVDEFVVTQSDVQSFDNTMTTFHKFRDGSDFSIGATTSEYSRGSTITANPGRIYHSDGQIFLPLIDDSIPEENPEDPIDPIDISPEICPVIPFVIDEIYNGDEYTHYIELLFTQDWQGGLVLSGESLTTSVEISSQSWEKNKRYIIAHSSSGLLHTDNIIIRDTLVIGSGQLLFGVEETTLAAYLVVDGYGAWYNQGMIDCDVLMTVSGSPSPGFDEQFLPYMGVIPPVDAPYCPVIDDDPQDPDEQIGTPLGTGGLTGLADLRLSLIDYDPPGSDTNAERIGLLSLSGDVLLSGRKLMYESKTYHFASGTVLSGQEYIRTANFQMVNSRPVCVNLYYITTHVDVACYDPSVHSSPYLPLVEPEQSFNYADLQFSLISLVYDPPGSDTDNETVTIRFDGGAEEVILDDLRLRVGTTNKRIYGTIFSGQTLTLVGNFQMPNSRDTCVALTYGEIVYDEYCYTISTTSTSNTQNQSFTVDYSSYGISIIDIDYDPPGSDTDNETVTLSIRGDGVIDLSQLYLRYDGKNRYLKGIVSPGSAVVIQGNYQLPNSKATCVDLMQGNHIFDTYCYNPDDDKRDTDDNLSGVLLSGVSITIDNLIYDPPGSDTNNEVVTFTVSEPLVLQQPLYLSFDNKKKKLSDLLSLSGSMSVVGNYQMPNSKATCVQLLYGSQVLDEYCYDPAMKEIVLSGVVVIDQWSGLQLKWVLPNPKGKDIINQNELISLERVGQNGQVVDKSVKLKIGTTTIPLSGTVLSVGENIIVSSKTLPNTPQCLSIYVGDSEVDRLCYPQAKDDTRYYHPRLGIGPSTIPSTLIDALDFQQGSLSKLLLKKIDNKICLTYEGVQIRCMNAGESTTSAKNRALLTLNNAYIARITNLYYQNQLHPQILRHRLQSYTALSQRIKNNQLSPFLVQGSVLKPTELDRYVDVVYEQKTDEYILDQFGRSLFGHDKMDEYYRKVYQ